MIKFYRKFLKTKFKDKFKVYDFRVMFGLMFQGML
jgi:hypothetical protein